MTILTQSLDFQSQALLLRADRQRVLASNIANADTPGYQARDMDFAAALRAATRDAASAQGAAATGSSGPIGMATAGRYTAAGVAARLDTPLAARLPGQGVQAAGAAAQVQTTMAPMPTMAGIDDPADLIYARHAQDSVDRNTVDMDRERATIADNGVRYEATLRFINSGVRTMLDAMKSHTQA